MQAAAGRIGEACHGAEHGPVGQGDVLDLQRFHCVPLLLDKTMKNYYITNRESADCKMVSSSSA